MSNRLALEKKRIIILTTPTTHHRYFINRLIQDNLQIVAIINETSHVKPSFPTGPFLEAEQEAFELHHFFTDLPFKTPNEPPTHFFETVNTEEAVEKIQSYAADLGIVFGCGKIRPHVFAATKDGLINIHRGIAERYRGLDSDLWAIYQEDFGNLGVTIHRVDDKMDTGDILKSAFFPLRKDLEIFQLRYYTTVLATNLMLELLAEYQSGQPLTGRQQLRPGKYYSFMPLALKQKTQSQLKSFILQG